MPYKSKEARRRYQVEWRRRKRAEAVKSTAGLQKNLSNPPGKSIQTVQDVKACLSHEISIVKSSRAEPLHRARVIGFLCNVFLKIIEVSELADVSS